MQIPIDAIIAREKLTHYLLIPKPKNDKSGYLAQAGFTIGNPKLLEMAIRTLIAENEAISERVDQYGTFYQVSGWLRGPSGILNVITIWLRQSEDDTYRFVTLKPKR